MTVRRTGTALLGAAALACVTIAVLREGTAAPPGDVLGLGEGSVQRRPFDVPRLLQNGESGRAVTYEEIETRVRRRNELRFSSGTDLEHLVALDPQRGLAFARATLEGQLPPTGSAWGRGAWDSRVAGLDDAWARDFRKVVFNRVIGDNWTPEAREDLLARERVADLASPPGEPPNPGATHDPVTSLWFATLTRIEVADGLRLRPALRTTDDPPALRLVQRWRTASDVAHAFATTRGADLRTIIYWADAWFPSFPADVRRGMLAQYRRTPGLFRDGTLGFMLEESRRGRPIRPLNFGRPLRPTA